MLNLLQIPRSLKRSRESENFLPFPDLEFLTAFMVFSVASSCFLTFEVINALAVAVFVPMMPYIKKWSRKKTDNP